MKDKHRFIDDLVSELRPVRPLASPFKRAAFFFLLAVLVHAVLLGLFPGYKSTWSERFLANRFLAFEILAALILSGALLYRSFTAGIPGERVSALGGLALGFSFTLLVLFLGLSRPRGLSAHWSAPPDCALEVFLLGLAGSLFAYRQFMRGYPRNSPLEKVAVVFAGGLIPATLMQMACVYEPMHGLIFHYGPLLVLIPAGLPIFNLLRGARNS